MLTTLSATSPVSAQPTSPQPLWKSGSVPGALGTDPAKDIPTLTPYLPHSGKATGAAMVICPGGGYEHLADHEGRDYALWLNERGIAGFVLKYRLGGAGDGYHHPAMLQDAQRAIRLVRSRAAEWKIDVHKVGHYGLVGGRSPGFHGPDSLRCGHAGIR